MDESLPPPIVLSGDNVDSAWELFREAFMFTVRRFIPTKLSGRRTALPPWFTKEVKRSCLSQRDKARAFAKTVDTQSAWLSFRQLRNRAVTVVRNAKQ